MDDGVPLSALAAELVGIYSDAPTVEDEEYAVEAIDDLLDTLDESDDDVLYVLLDLPESELTAPLAEDVVSMLADTGPRVVARLLELAVTGVEPAASRALDAFDRMDDDARADGLFGVLASGGPDDLRRTAADELVALGHAGAAHLQAAFADPWTRDLARAAVGAAGAHRAPCAGAAPGSVQQPAPARPQVDEPTDEPARPSRDRSTDPAPRDATVHETPSAAGDVPTPGDDALEAEYRAFLERFRRESGL